MKNAVKLIGVILRQNHSPSALGTRKGVVGPCSEGQLSDTLLAIVVEVREDLGVMEVFMTNGAGYLLLQLLQPFLHGIWSFCHRNCIFFPRKGETAIKGVGKNG